MHYFVLVLCLLATVLARPEPELPQAYSYSHGLSINHQSDLTAHGSNHGVQTHGFSFTGGNGGAQMAYDSGYANQFSGPSGYAQHAHALTIQPSQSIEIPHVPQHNQHYHHHHHQLQQQQQQQTEQHHHNQQEQHSYVEQQSGGDAVGHRTYGIQQEENNHQQEIQHQQHQQEQEHHHNHIDAEISLNSGEGLIEPRLNLDAPPQTQNTYIPPVVQQQNAYIPPSIPVIQPQNTYIQPLSGSIEQSTYQSNSGYYPSSKVIHKHVYVHVPPKDFEDEPQPRQHFPVQQAQKHYKIIFIKAPSPPTYQQPIIPLIPQNEEKTLIYVLHRKPEEPRDIIIPTPAPTQPSKPEVYFIKYKTRKDSNVSGLYGAPASGSGDVTSAAGFADDYSSSLGQTQLQTQNGHNIEHETIIQTESENNNNHQQQHSSHDESTGPSAPIVVPQTSGYLPPHKTGSY